MALDDHTAQERLTPEARRAMLRAFGDRMLIKVTAMDDPEDMPGVERAVRVAAVIERLYSRCDRAEGQAPDPHKIEAERARHSVEAIQTRVALANTLAWGEKRRQEQGHWWDDAKAMAQGHPQELPQKSPLTASQAGKEVMADVAEPVAAEAVRQDELEEAPEDTGVASVDLTEIVAETAASQDASETEMAVKTPETQAEPQSGIPLSAMPEVTYVDYTDAITAWRIELGLDPAPD